MQICRWMTPAVRRARDTKDNQEDAVQEQESEMLTMKEACHFLGISRTTLLKMETEGLITPARTVGGHRRYPREELIHLIKAMKGLKNPRERALWGEGSTTALSRIVEQLAGSSASPRGLVQEALQETMRLLQAEGALLALLDDQGELHPWMGLGLDLPQSESQTVQDLLKSPLTGQVLELAEPLVYEDIKLGNKRFRVGIGAPLVYRGKLQGILHVLSLSRHQFLPSEVQFFSLVASYMASLLVNAELMEESKPAAEEAEHLDQ